MMSGFRVLLTKELLEQARSYRLLALASLFAVFGLGSPLVAKLTPQMLRMAGSIPGLTIALPEPTAQDAVTQFVKNLSQIVLLVVVLLASGSMVAEKERGTASFLLVKPVPRGGLILGYWLVTILGMVISSAGCLFYTQVLFGGTDVAAFLRTSLLMLAHLLTFVTTTLLFSTLARSQALAGILSFLAWVLLASLGMLGHISDFLPGRLIALALMPPGAAPVWEPLAGAAVIALASVLGALLAFRRWEP